MTFSKKSLYYKLVLTSGTCNDEKLFIHNSPFYLIGWRNVSIHEICCFALFYLRKWGTVAELKVSKYDAVNDSFRYRSFMEPEKWLLMLERLLRMIDEGKPLSYLGVEKIE